MKILHKSNNIEIREYPPIRRTIRILFYTPPIERSFYLWFPYQIFLWETSGEKHQSCCDSFRLALSSIPINSLNAFNLILPPLPNVFSDHSICLGGQYPESFDEAVDRFWQSKFVIDPEDGPWSGICILRTMIATGNLDGIINAGFLSKDDLIRDVRSVMKEPASIARYYEQWQQMNLDQVTRTIDHMRNRCRSQVIDITNYLNE
jgi:hypothetical protein